MSWHRRGQLPWAAYPAGAPVSYQRLQPSRGVCELSGEWEIGKGLRSLQGGNVTPASSEHGAKDGEGTPLAGHPGEPTEKELHETEPSG